jgi:phage recombination protein Bet
MSTQEQQQALTVQTSPLITELAGDWKISPATMINTLKATIFPQVDRDNRAVVVTNEQMVAFLQVCNTYKLNPFVKEIYAFPTKGGGIVPMVPVDGWANIINRHQQMDGVEFIDDWELDPETGQKKALFSTTCIIYRKDRSRPIKVTEYMQECVQPNKEPWKKWPARMLRHKAYIQCGRIAFSLGGIYDPDEAERIATGGEEKSEIKRPTTIEAQPVKTSAPAAVQGTEAEVAPATAGNGSSTAKHKPEPAATATQEEAKPETAAVEEAAAPGEASPAFEQQGPKCFCTCCKNLNCDCFEKAEFDRCGCVNCANYVALMAANPEVKAEPVEGEVLPPSKPEGPYVAQEKLKKLFAICASAGIKVVKDSHEDELHKKLKEKWGIESVKEIPVKLWEKVLEEIAPELKVKGK